MLLECVRPPKLWRGTREFCERKKMCNVLGTEFLRQESVALMLLGRKDLTLIFPSLTQALTAHIAQQCAPLLSTFLQLHDPQLTTLADIQTWPEWKVEEVSQGVGSTRHKNRSYWLCCTEATKSWVKQAPICFLIIFSGATFVTWRPLESVEFRIYRMIQ